MAVGEQGPGLFQPSCLHHHLGALGNALTQLAAFWVQSNRHHTPRTWLGFAVVERAEWLARGETHLEGTHDTLRVGCVHAFSLHGVQILELVKERLQALLFEPCIQRGA